MAALGGPGGVQPCPGGGRRVLNLGTVLPEGDQRCAIGQPQIKMRDEAMIDYLLDILPVEGLRGKPVGIVAMGGSAHHYLAVDTQLRQVLGWFGALVAPTGVYLTGADFRDGALTSEAARKDLGALVNTLLTLLQRLDPALLGLPPLAAKFI